MIRVGSIYGLGLPQEVVAPAKKPICKHCKVEVVGRNPTTGKANTRAILGKEHKPGCPRRRLGH